MLAVVVPLQPCLSARVSASVCLGGSCQETFCSFLGRERNGRHRCPSPTGRMFARLILSHLVRSVPFAVVNIQTHANRGFAYRMDIPAKILDDHAIGLFTEVIHPQWQCLPCSINSSPDSIRFLRSVPLIVAFPTEAPAAQLRSTSCSSSFCSSTGSIDQVVPEVSLEQSPCPSGPDLHL